MRGICEKSWLRVSLGLDSSFRRLLDVKRRRMGSTPPQFLANESVEPHLTRVVVRPSDPSTIVDGIRECAAVG
jgi:hypothetical protein